MLIFNKFDIGDFLQGASASMGLTAFVMIILTLVGAWLARKRKGSGTGPDSDGKTH
jgi:hypothetical protein